MQIAYSKHTHTAWKNRLKVEGAPLCTSWFLCRVNWLLSIEIDGSQNQSQQSSAIRYQLGFLSRDYSAKISWPCSAYDHNQQFPSHDQHSLRVLAVATQTHSYTHGLDKHTSGRMHLPSQCRCSRIATDFCFTRVLHSANEQW